jgi:hypothetical protein
VIGILLNLLVAHAVADGPLQTDATRALKYHRVLGWRIAGLWLHGSVHGLLACYATFTLWVFFAEAVTHTAIDGARQRLGFNLVVDQSLHVLSKVVWAWLLTR